MAASCEGRGRTPRRRASARRRCSGGRKHPQTQDVTSGVPGGRKRECVCRRVWLVGEKPHMGRFGSSAFPAKAERQTRGESEAPMTPGIVPLTKRVAESPGSTFLEGPRGASPEALRGTLQSARTRHFTRGGEPGNRAGHTDR